MADLVPSALQAMEEDAEITFATKVSEPTRFSLSHFNIKLVTKLNPICPFTDSQQPEIEDMNEVEKPQVPLPPRTTARPKTIAPKKPVSRPSSPKNTNPRTMPSKTPSSTFLGSYNNCIPIKIIMNFNILHFLICFFPLQLTILSVRQDCEISAVAQPAAGEVISVCFHIKLV